MQSLKAKPQTLRGFLRKLMEKGLVEKVSRPVNLESIPVHQYKVIKQRKAVFFERIVSKSRDSYLKLVSNLFFDRKRIANSLGLTERSLGMELLHAINNPRPYIPNQETLDLGFTKTNGNLFSELPIVKHFREDRGPYITSAVVVSRDPETGRQNLSIHRMMPISRNKLVVRVVEGRDLHKFYVKAAKQKKPLDVAVLIGVDPVILLAAATSTENIDEMFIANSLLKGELKVARCNEVDLNVPKNVEIVLEGKIYPGEKVEEGPFVEIIGVDIERKQPVITVYSVSRKKDAIYYDIFPTSMEHELLMGIPREPVIYKAASKHCEVMEVVMSPAGSHWVEAVVKIKKEFEDQPFLVGISAFHAHPSLKRVIIVDEDVNIHDYVEIQKAVIQRTYPPLDYHVIKGIMGSSLDHSNIRVERKEKTVEYPKCKEIIDATIKGPPYVYLKPKVAQT